MTWEGKGAHTPWDVYLNGRWVTRVFYVEGMDAEEPSYRYWRERAAEAWDEAETGGYRFADSRMARARILLVDWLKAEWDDEADVKVTIGGRVVEACVYVDLINAALGSVDWHEIAETLLEDVETAEEKQG